MRRNRMYENHWAILDGAAFHDKKTAHDMIRRELCFPDYYGEVRRTLQENGFRHIMTFEELEWLYYRRAKLRGGAEDRNNREDR